MLSTSLGLVLTTVLLLGSVPPSGIHSHEQDRHSLAPSPDTRQEAHGTGSGPERISPPAEQPQAVRECPEPQGSLTIEAFSRMAAGGAFSVWDITGSVTSSSEMQALRSLIVYHGMRPRTQSRTHVLLQVELTLSPTGGFLPVTTAVLRGPTSESRLQIRQEPSAAGAGPRLLLEGVVDLHKLQTFPHKLELMGGEGGSVKIATIENIMLR